MRIIRTVAGRGSTVKGWVREGVLGALTQEPLSLTEISDRLGVSKSTASYHLSLLVERGAIEVVGSTPGRGGVPVRRYSLRGGSVVLIPTATEEEEELRRIRETFDLEVLSWKSRGGELELEDLERLLYKMFLHLFRIGRTGHRELMEEFGSRAGGVIAERVPGAPSRVSVLDLVSYVRKVRAADADVVEVPNSPVAVAVSGVCLGSSVHPSNACYFLEGMLRGIASAKWGSGVKVGRVPVSSVPGCCFAVGRVRALDLAWVADAVLASHSYSAINRGRGRQARVG